ncbi:MAG: AAA family ATPase [Flavobacteriales bacterium]|nr:AAA family ATPase [Flavobacteriales bacterium]
MESQEIAQLLRQNFPFEPTHDQHYAIDVLARFLPSKVKNPLLILKGYAGTGKTSLVITLVKSLPKLNLEFVLMAPTGRASKVLSNYTHKLALTIHKKIFAVEKLADGTDGFSLAPNRHTNTVFIIDEASMISGETEYFTGSSLLEDVIKYVYNNKSCRLIFLGDTAQLPPVGSPLSPALNLDYIKRNYDVAAAEVELTEVVRQEQNSGILHNATTIRETLQEDADLIKFDINNFDDVKNVSGYDLEEELETAYSQFGWEDTIVICRSNKTANIFNQQIRTRIRWQEDEISAGDYMMVVRNNYYWLPKESKAGFIANGDTIEIMKIGGDEERYGLRFVEATIRLIDYPDEPEHEVKLLLDTIMANTPSLTSKQNKQFYNAVMEDYMDIPNKRERMLKLKADPYFNALQVKFGYAVTCHKSQGGQWKAVFVDQGYLTDDSVDIEYLRWLYTAFTRATEKLYLVNFHEKFFTE